MVNGCAVRLSILHVCDTEGLSQNAEDQERLARVDRRKMAAKQNSRSEAMVVQCRWAWGGGDMVFKPFCSWIGSTGVVKISTSQS